MEMTNNKLSDVWTASHTSQNLDVTSRLTVSLVVSSKKSMILLQNELCVPCGQ